MKSQKKAILFSLVLLLCIVIYAFVRNKELSLRYISDASFMVSLVCLVVAGFLYVLATGMFDFFQRSIRHALRRWQKHQPKEVLPLSQAAGKGFRFWLITGLILLITALAAYFLL